MSIIVQHRRDTRTNCELGTPASGELFYDTTLKALRIGDGSTLGGFLQKRWRYSYPLVPSQITSSQDNYNPTDLQLGETFFLDADAARSITGIAGGGFGARITLINRGSFDITLVNNATSTAANRFLFESDVVLRPKSAIELQYSTTDSRWMRADGGIKFSTVPQEFLFTGVISPAQITANQNDYAPVDAVTATKTTALSAILRLSADASHNITGIVDPRDGVVKTLINVGSNPIVLVDASASSTAANRFDFGANVTLAAKQSAKIRYDGTDARWKLVAATAGASVAAGAVTAQTLATSSMGAFVGMINGTIVPSVAASALTIALKTLAGTDPTAADPVYAVFRSATAATGDFTVLTVTAATSLVISSGSSVGVSANNTAFKLWPVGFNDAGTFRLGVINCLSGTSIYPLASWGIASSTAEGGAGAADAAQTFYTGTAVASKSYIPLAYMTWESGLAAAGTWSAGPTRTQLFGHDVMLPGARFQPQQSFTGAMSTGTGLIPADDTIPQNTEGDQYMSAAITPSSAANLIDVDAQLYLSNSAGNRVAAALFQDSVANALATSAHVTTGTDSFTLTLAWCQLAALSVATTFKIRAGGFAAGTTTFNGVSGARHYGGVSNSFLRLWEIVT